MLMRCWILSCMYDHPETTITYRNIYRNFSKMIFLRFFSKNPSKFVPQFSFLAWLRTHKRWHNWAQIEIKIISDGEGVESWSFLNPWIRSCRIYEQPCCAKVDKVSRVLAFKFRVCKMNLSRIYSQFPIPNTINQSLNRTKMEPNSLENFNLKF